MPESAPRIALPDGAGGTFRGPATRPALAVFGKWDCPTCRLCFPLIDRLAGACADAVDVLWVAQDEDGGARWRASAKAVRILDDSALDASRRFDPEAVPTAYHLGPDGEERDSLVGFVRAEWRKLFDAVASEAGVALPGLDWGTLPESRPGCGSRHLDPSVVDELELPPGSERLAARHMRVGEADDPFEFLFDQGLTDGLPVVPPTPHRVLRMLEGTRREATEVVATVPPNLVPVTVEKVAINAVMAGALPSYLPAILAAVEAVCSDAFNLHGVLATTFFSSPILVVNGPARDALGINYRENCLGQGARANATIGRAVQLIVQNVGGGRPGGVDRALMGQPGKFSFCFGEHEARSRWEPLHVERGFDPGESTVTAFAGSGPVAVVDQLSRDARSLATSYGRVLASSMHPKLGGGEVLVVVPPEHVDTFARDGWSKDQIRERILEASERRVRDVARDAECAEGAPPRQLEGLDPDAPFAKFARPGDIHLVVAGGEAGKFAALLQGWAAGPTGSTMTTRPIGD